MMKHSMATVCAHFNSHRMVEEYMEDYYVTAGLAHQILGENRLSRAKELRNWKQKIRSLWKDVKILEVSLPSGDRVALGEDLEVTAAIQLGQLSDVEVAVDLCYGQVVRDSEAAVNRDITVMRSEGRQSDGIWRFKGVVPCQETGVYAYRVRVLPFHPCLVKRR